MSKKTHHTELTPEQINHMVDYLKEQFDSPLDAISACLIVSDIIKTSLGIKIHEDTIKKGYLQQTESNLH